jgi:hypothetical protein
VVPSDPAGSLGNEPTLELGLELTLSLVGDHAQHVDRKHGILLVVGSADILPDVHDRTSHE